MTDPTKPSRVVRVATILLLLAAVGFTFAGVWNCGWLLYDDQSYVVQNPHVRSGFTAANVQWALTSPHGGNWHPLTSLSHMLDVELFGSSPRGPHAVNLVLHALNAVLLLCVWFGYSRAWWQSAFVAGLFALHPLRVESVAWVSERKDVLSAFFFLATLEAYRRYAREPKAMRMLAVAAALALGLMAKPMLVTTPCVLILLDVWPLRRWQPGPGWLVGLWRLVREKALLFALALGSSIATLIAQRASSAVVDARHLSVLEQGENALVAYMRYLETSFWPVDLAPFYPRETTTLSVALLAGGLLAVLTFVAVRLFARERSLLVGWLWFLGTLVPVIGLVQVGSQAFADRYTYIPSMGLWIACVSGVGARAARWPAVAKASAGVTVLALIALMLRTRDQVELWRDTRTLFAHTLSVTENNARAHQLYANVLLREGAVDEAILHLNAALAIAPEYPDAHGDLGSALGMKGRFAESVEHLRFALSREESADKHHNLACSLYALGRIDEAIAECEAALRLDPNHLAAHQKLAQWLRSKGRANEAAVHAARAAELKPPVRDR